MERFTIKSKGEYYIGDICYVLSDDVYHDFWGRQHSFNDGSFTVPKSKLSFATVSTDHGDGTYKDQYGMIYPVDAGNIGIVPIELCSKTEGLNEGRVSDFVGEVHISVDEDGVVEVFEGDDDEPVIIIETAPYYDDVLDGDEFDYDSYSDFEEDDDNWNDGDSGYYDDDDDEEDWD